MGRPSRAVLVVSVAVALGACGIDALGTMPTADSAAGEPPPGAKPPAGDATAPETDAAADLDAGSDVDLPDATVDAPIDAPVGPLLELTHAPAAANVDLTAEGTLDWAIWAVNGNTSAVRKNTVNQISLLTRVFATTGIGTGFGTTFSWTDAPNGSGSSSDYFFVQGLGCKYQVHVPSGPVKRTFIVWVGGSEIRGKLTASLADGSLMAKTDTSYESQDGTFGVRYAIDFRTVAVSQLDVEWSIDEEYGTNSARFVGAALR